MRPWIAFFSQTGTEINNLCTELQIYPDAIVTNRSDLKSVNKDLLYLTEFREHKLNKTILHYLPAKPVASNYLKVLNLIVQKHHLLLSLQLNNLKHYC